MPVSQRDAMSKVGYCALSAEQFQHWLWHPKSIPNVKFFESVPASIYNACAWFARRPDSHS